MPAAAKKTAAAQTPAVKDTTGYSPAFVERVKAVAAEPSIGPFTGEEMLARIARIAKGVNG